MESKGTNITQIPRVRCIKWSMCKVISILVIAVQVRPIDGFFYRNSHTLKQMGTYFNDIESRNAGNIELNNVVSDLRINPSARECNGPFCTRCRARVSSPHHMPEPSDCKVDQNVKNSSCYLCNRECKTLGDLQSKNIIMCGQPVEITCCLIAQMGNLGHVCGLGGQYNCYGDMKPMCQCPYGKLGERCQLSNKDTLNCRCYKPAYKFCGQDDIIECNNKTRGPDVTQCHMGVNRHGKRHNCICDLEDGHSEVNGLESC
ncbi:uncharacterized protein LOC128555643 [Mercenaria mercenaria]|uniref:uncharacterized protein LOC128555643 n=1 Tax=Mercenaria mercenaria TaxID=6596 RepID=UPI00234E6A1F|nr:uncharacterized protein LOC128555643 [Mercenaria mercenaria]XP_053394614.1 uncharacterized protein LOC128555643 [Mercenaria mercenaria]XP_053394615.1 uncharacterized protein LOC128555643 [Mercenaria mercenaria]